jgi:2,3-dihydroxybenzoate decarboxylase
MTHELKTGGDRGYLRIATEEAFGLPEQLDAYVKLVKDGKADKGTVSLWGFYGTSSSERSRWIRDRLVDLDDLRLAAMDETGVDVAILSMTSPGGQVFEAEFAKSLVRKANDVLASAVERHPTRYAGMVTIVPQDPAWSVAEIARGKTELGFKGVMVNSHTQGHYLDEEQFDPILRACVENDLPLYIHPQGPPDNLIGTMVEAGLDGAVFGFGVETSFHLLRLLTTGVFDRYPDLTICVGHGGEAIPYWLFRMNYMHLAGVRSQRYERLKPLKHDLFHYMRNNVLATNSGLPFGPAIKTMIEVMGEDRVMYAMDYPYQYLPEEVVMMDDLDITPAQKKKFFQTNAERWFKL